jgi:endoglucanase
MYSKPNNDSDRSGYARKFFSHVRSVALATGAALLMSIAGGGQACSATQVSAARLTLLAKGINVGAISTDSVMSTYTPDDLAQLHAMGFTNVRMPIDPSWVLAGVPINPKSGASNDAHVALGLSQLDQNISTFVQAGFAVTLCIHPETSVVALPYSQSEDIILRAVDVLVKRYAAHFTPDQMFFEALNEPHYDPVTWNTLGPQIVAVIRNSAPAHTIIYPPSWNDIPTNFQYMTMPNDMNIIYTMHVYQPSKLTMQGSIGPLLPNYLFPRPAGTVVDPTEWTYVKLSTYMRPAIDWAARKNVPLIMNEFGATSGSDRTSRLNWIRFARQYAETNHVGWTWWDFHGNLFGLKPRGGAWDQDLVKALGN